MVTNPLSASVTISFSVPVSVSPSFAFTLALPFTLFLPLSFLLPLFFPLRFACSSLSLSLLLLGAFFPLSDFPALTGDFLFHGLQISILLIALSPSGANFGSIFFICLCALDPLFLGHIFTDLNLSKLADLLFDCANVDQAFKEGLGFSVDTRAVKRAVDKGDGFAAVERQ